MGVLSSYGQAKKDSVLPKVDSLKPVIVRPTAIRPHMKRDTLEYNTENIRLRTYANVEELIGRLPGLQIDANGNITYNGERIQRLLVDGEDIFGGDPTLITRNLDASKIAKVQLLERKSNQALFTGIDDGSRTKTLNLVLKEAARDSYSGKIEAGGNAKGNYDAKGFLAAFRGKEQFAGLGFAANTGTTRFNGGSGGGISFNDGSSDPLGASAGTGIPHFAATALHYANTWDGSANHLTGNYQFGHYSTSPVTTTHSIQIQPDSIYGQDQLSRSVNRQDQHSFTGTYEFKPGARSALQVFYSAIQSSGQNQFAATGNSTFNDTLVNSSQRTIRDKVNRLSLMGYALWKTQIGSNPERILSATLEFGKNDVSTDGYLFSQNRFYRPDGSLNSMDTIDQRKQITDHTLAISPNINYAQPLWKGAVMGLSYRYSFTGDDPLQATYDKGEGKYGSMVDSLSSHLKLQVVKQYATISLQGKSQHLNYSIMNAWIDYRYHQRDWLTGATPHLHYLNWSPWVNVTYTVNPTTSLVLNYSSSVTQPSITQLQVVKNNNDPLHITLGNPDLKSSSNQSFSFEYRRIRSWMMNLGLHLGFVSNNISTRTITDSLGRQISQPVNVDGGMSSALSFSLSKKILGFDAGFRATGSYSRAVNYINADLSNNDTYSAGGGLSLNRYLADKYSLQLYSSLNYFDAVSSINTAAPLHYWTQSHAGALTLFLVRNFEMNTNATYTWQQKTSAFAGNTSVLLWNAYVSRNFMNNRLALRIQLNNILDRNAGITRTNTANITTESATNILGRYYLLSAIYHFDRKFGKKEKTF